jgi:putative oxidoreductase
VQPAYDKKGNPLRLRFSTFPDGWPGAGLLLLRASVSLPLIYWAVADLYRPFAGASLVSSGVLSDVAEGMAGLVLLAGLWTRVTAVLIAICDLWIAFSAGFAPTADQWIHILLAALSASVSMLGPGAWSIDARRFGRKVFDIGDRSETHDDSV